MATTRRRKEIPAADAKTILNRVRQLVRALRAFDKEAQSRYGVGAAQMFILHVLRDEGELSMNELADRTATDQSSVSLAASRLVEEGFVDRTFSEVDRRQVRLSLTARGRALVRRSPPAAQAKILASVGQMSAGERRQLISLLEKLMSGMGVSGAPASMLFQDEQKPRRK